MGNYFLAIYRLTRPDEIPEPPKSEKPDGISDHYVNLFQTKQISREEFEWEVDWCAGQIVTWEEENWEWLKYKKTHLVDGEEAVWGDNTEMYRLELPEHDKAVIVAAVDVIPTIKQWGAEYPEICESDTGYNDLTHLYKGGQLRLVVNLLYTDQTGLQIGFTYDDADKDMVRDQVVLVEQHEHHIVLDTYRDKLYIVLPEDYEDVAARDDIRTDLTGLQELDLKK